MASFRLMGHLRSARPISAACGSMVLLLALATPSATFAQSVQTFTGRLATYPAMTSVELDKEYPHDAYASSSVKAVPDIMIHGAKDATPWAEPGPENAVPSWAQESYKVYLQMKAKAHGGTVKDTNHMPDWSGLWSVTREEAGDMWDGQAVAKVARGEGAAAAKAILEHCFHGNTYTLPCPGWFLGALTPEHALQYREQLTANAHEISWNPLSDCYPHAFPGIMIGPFGREFITSPKETWMTRQTLNEIRRVYTDGRGHIPMNEAFPLVMGDSIGFWDGDTLVIHTLYVPATRVGAEDTPDHSDELSAIERITLTDPNTLTNDATLYDPLMLTQPWHAVHHYDRETSAHDHVNYYTCDQNIYQKPDGNTGVILPGDSLTITRTFRDTTQIPNRGGAIGSGGGTDAIITTGTKILRQELGLDSTGEQRP